MRKAKLSVAVYIGRFQPLHKGHLATLKAALLEFDCVAVLIGSAQEARTCQNPWSYKERKSMIEHALTKSQLKRIRIIPLPDFPADEEWLDAISMLIKNSFTANKIEKIITIGYAKDNSSYYLKLMAWPLKEFKDESFIMINSTAIRNCYFSSSDCKNELPEAVAAWLDQFKLKHPRVFNRLKKVCAS